MTNGFSHPYHLDESTFIYRGIRSDCSFLFHFSMKFMQANKIAPDGTPHFGLRNSVNTIHVYLPFDVIAKGKVLSRPHSFLISDGIDDFMIW